MNSNREYSVTLAGLALSTLILLVVISIGNVSEDVANLLIIVHIIVLVFWLGSVSNLIGLILLGAFLFRCFLLYLDQFTSIPVFSSGVDTENFYRTAVLIFENPMMLGEDTFGGQFPKLAALFFWTVDLNRVLFQYMNVLLGTASLIFIAMAGRQLGVPVRNLRIILIICSFMPIAASISSIFLRESIITFLVSISVFYFCCWIANAKIKYAVGALLSISAAGIFHLGVFGIALGYLTAFVLFDQQSGKFNFSFNRVLGMLPILGGFVYLILSFSGLFLQKFEKFSSASDILESTTSSRGGSAYLPGVEINSPIELILFGWLKALLLLVSPPPWAWRGILDVASFFLDGFFFLVALILIVIAIRGRRGSLEQESIEGRKRRILVVLSIGLIASAFILGAGTSNSGTALRHRQKLVPLVAVTAMFALPTRRNNSSEIRNVKFQVGDNYRNRSNNE